ncbi:MAG: hypothetical protein Kow0099_23480 [Candidatus Abyssubacteria bacterium]
MAAPSYVKCGQCNSVNRVNEEKQGRPLCGKCGSPLDISKATPDRPLDFSDASFSREVLAANVPVLVDFYATWCGACRSVEPSIEVLASQFRGKLKVGKLDVERNPQTANTYQIRATPTLIVFRNGRVAEQVTGALPQTQLEELVRKHTA